MDTNNIKLVNNLQRELSGKLYNQFTTYINGPTLISIRDIIFVRKEREAIIELNSSIKSQLHLKSNNI